MNALVLLESGIDNWNLWRSRHPHVPINLAGQNLSHGYFFEGNLRGVNLSGANLQRACLIGADLTSADLTSADLTNADLTGAYLGSANFTGANLSRANLKDANLDRADLRRTNLIGVNIVEADIRTAILPDPNADPYVDEIVNLLFEQRLARSAQSKASISKRGSSAYSTAVYRQSLLHQMIARIPALTQHKRAITANQQAVRQSAVVFPKVSKAQPQNHIRYQSDSIGSI